ncbi:ovochymase-like [Pieris napi]|uniref:ovochymase-like n=1 Tax=Pieris napi TaxID=78633 RepID=UPI001FB88102|nr:ovochymase-like [Pieris napi]
MYQNKMIIIVAILVTGDCLEEIPRRDDIHKTEAIVEHTINSLFSTLKLKRIQQRPKILEYTTLHKYFASLSLQDDYNLKKILQLTKVNSEHKFYNGTDFIAVINEIINEDIVNRLNVDDISVISYIERFISRLKKWREIYAPKTIYVNINFKVLEHLQKTVNKSFDSKSQDNLITSDNEFWEPSGRRIYRGQRTKIKYFPFMASVHIFNNFHCAGSIIKSDLIITASSCLQLAWNNRLFRENPAFLSVRVGSSFYSGGGEVIPVLEIYFHPGYDPKSLRNNICILRLVRRLNFRKRNKRVKRINIDRNPWNLPMNTPGVTILGWGAKGSSGIVYDPWKNILSYSILDIYPLPDCRDVYTRFV